MAPSGFHGDGFDYILSRTSLRPREVIQFCRLAYRASLEGGERRIGLRALLEAEEEFSRWRAEHLWSEHLFTFPELESVVECFRHQSKALPYEVASEVITTFLLPRLGKDTTPDWLRDVDEHEVVRVLFSIGFLGFRESTQAAASTPSPGRAEYVYHYERPAGKVRTGVDLQVHPGFWRHLEIQV